MTATYDQTHTALLLVDPYNDFLTEGGKLSRCRCWPWTGWRQPGLPR